jgi:hypothetical protein
VDRTITLVLVNMKASVQSISVLLPKSLSVTSLQAHLTSSSVSFARQKDLPVSGNQVSLTIPAYSVLTLHGETADR